MTESGYRDKQTLSLLGWWATHISRQRCVQAADSVSSLLDVGKLRVMPPQLPLLAEVKVLAASLVLNHVAQSLIASSLVPSKDCESARVSLQSGMRPDPPCQEQIQQLVQGLVEHHQVDPGW